MVRQPQAPGASSAGGATDSGNAFDEEECKPGISSSLLMPFIAAARACCSIQSSVSPASPCEMLATPEVASASPTVPSAQADSAS